MKDPILLIGTGALATLFAARLSEAGHAVSMLGAWQKGIDELNQHGARIQGADGVIKSFPVFATHNPQAVSGVKLALVLVKAWQTERAAQQLQIALASDGLALTLQNGLGNQETLQTALGVGRVAVGVTTTGATLLAPGLARFGGEGLISLEQNPASVKLAAFFRSAQFNAQVVEDAEALIWGKLIVNAAINPLTALLEIPNGALLTHPDTRKVMSALAEEAAEVARAEGVRLPFDDPTAAAEAVAQKTALNDSSMLQDLRRGAPTEIDAISGAVALRGEKRGTSTPYTKACWAMVRAAAYNRGNHPGGSCA
ncbi:MAG: 2-dehydropantoate 2-reductase [Anaerolineales bacterium]|nr:2-dehydropantoate 2-reductase [Anaerolineales bacterium]